MWSCTTKKWPADKFRYAAGGNVTWFAVFINTNKAAFDKRDIGFADVLRECGDVINTNVAKVGIKKEPGFLYFIDKQGDISSAAMVKGGKKKKKAKK